MEDELPSLFRFVQAKPSTYLVPVAVPKVSRRSRSNSSAVHPCSQRHNEGVKFQEPQREMC